MFIIHTQKSCTLIQFLPDPRIDDLQKSRGLHSVRAFKHGPVYIYRSMPAGVAQSGHAFVGGTVSMWGRWRIPVNKRQKRHQKCQSNTAYGERADQIVGSPSWSSSINYNRSMPEDLKVLQISSSPLPPPFRGLHSPRIRKHCQIIFATISGNHLFLLWTSCQRCIPVSNHPVQRPHFLDLNGPHQHLQLHWWHWHSYH